MLYSHNVLEMDMIERSHHHDHAINPARTCGERGAGAVRT